ncbi:hypothetical protein [Photobacterium indicum]|uniref:hypothetical protein n=1 Tax=Photobacterium indicum TaxID=81447 RepID=UPI003D1084DA
MKYAGYRSPNGKPITANEFIEKAGHDYKDRKTFPYCFHCKQIVYPKGVGSVHRNAYYAHLKYDNTVAPTNYCIETLKGKQYAQLTINNLKKEKSSADTIINKIVRLLASLKNVMI